MTSVFRTLLSLIIIGTGFPTSLMKERNKKCQAKDGEAKKTEKTRAVTQQRSVILW